MGDIEDPLKDVKLEPPLDATPIEEKAEEVTGGEEDVRAAAPAADGNVKFEDIV